MTARNTSPPPFLELVEPALELTEQMGALLSLAASPFRSLAAWLDHNVRVRQTIDRLEKLDDRMLRDIGLRRDAIDHLAANVVRSADAAKGGHLNL